MSWQKSFEKLEPPDYDEDEYSEDPLGQDIADIKENLIQILGKLSDLDHRLCQVECMLNSLGQPKDKF